MLKKRECSPMKPLVSRCKKIQTIIRKNFKILMRSKSSALIIVFGPLLLILLAGLAYNDTDQFHINVGVYSTRYSNVTISVLTQLSESEFDVARHPVEDACIDSVKRGRASICIIFPPDLDVKQDGPQDILFYVDPSDINLVHNVLAVMSSKVKNESEAISRNLTDDLLQRLANTEGEADSRVPTVVDLTHGYDAIAEKSASASSAIASLDAAPIGTEPITKLNAEADFLKQLTLATMGDEELLISQLRKETQGMSEASSLLDKYEASLLQYKIDYRQREAALNDSIIAVVGSVAGADARLGQLESAKAAAQQDLAAVKDTLTGSLQLLNQMQVSLNNIKKISTTLEIKDAATIVNPITMKIVPVLDRTTHFNYAFPTILVLVMMITGILLGSILVMVEKKSSSFFRNSITPTIDSTFMIATALTALIIMAVQLAIFLAISAVFFKAALWPSLLSLPFLLALISALFVMLGILLGTLFTSEETTILAGISVASILLLFSSAILPIENMPFLLRALAGFNPFVLSETVIKEALFFDFGISLLLPKLALLAGYTAILFAAALSAQRSLRASSRHGGKATPFERVKEKLFTLKNRAIVTTAVSSFKQLLPGEPDAVMPVFHELNPVEEGLLSASEEASTARKSKPLPLFPRQQLFPEKPVFDFIAGQPKQAPRASRAFPNFSEKGNGLQELSQAGRSISLAELQEMKSIEQEIAGLESLGKSGIGEQRTSAAVYANDVHVPNVQKIGSRLEGIRERREGRRG
ncbi:ABC transporter permease [Candidatus Woesearchaeota archaeon]|nr:ABC transporter permease [Candidatus Woesearchaeota archaeon]